ncbi:probable ribose-5-phosphate isomerase 4, chloroplastic isoform X2 [Coffea eugenioides]|uniref:probable ribose-5-phosphate isomerase 4, chloroplastic isoform X2 n=1 Tax=Coffea eugenioides TaxID=49369 RepID=UPI000F60FA58|nr:probable ribose-5-phosphate isomerase 4, chloroplastic isoform X2 [Coffea eugenioides]
MASSSVLPFSSSFRSWFHPCLASKITFTRRTNSLSIVTRSSLSDNSALLQAAKHTVDSYVKSGMVVGFGAGHASDLAIHYLGQQLKAGALKDIVGTPTCVGSASVAAKIDVAFSDADVIEEVTLSAIIGRRKMMGEESIIQEKTILGAAEKLVFIVTEKQYRSDLDGSIPVLIQSFNWMETAEEIDDLFLGDAEVWRRPSVGYAGPLGGDFPMVTKEGHNVLDLIFTSPIISLADVANCLEQVDGVVEHGIICRIPCTAVIASENGQRIIDNNLILEAGRA